MTTLAFDRDARIERMTPVFGNAGIETLLPHARRVVPRAAWLGQRSRLYINSVALLAEVALAWQCGLRRQISAIVTVLPASARPASAPC
jgi:hypothetical protein